MTKSIFACFADGCPRDQNGSHSGNFSSPYYPINYPNKKRCTWGITVPSDYRILVVFDEFGTERNSDVLKIYGGVFKSSEVLATLSGDFSGSTYGSSGPSLWFGFTTDGRITEKGFHATYTATQQPSMYCSDPFSLCPFMTFGLVMSSAAKVVVRVYSFCIVMCISHS